MNLRLFLFGLALAHSISADGDSSLPFNIEPVTIFDEPWAMAFLPDNRMLVTAVTSIRLSGKNAIAQGSSKIVTGSMLNGRDESPSAEIEWARARPKRKSRRFISMSQSLIASTCTSYVWRPNFAEF